ncbi:hypothetical protein WS98_05795 [Burkholderia territorii]|uniref:hypothetical protein n=1 Tax=Burkholderia territorii TaxID=1503055 RepID=UPI00075E5B77|nr:hypothetical protein [Burkholderia territorii]KVL41415.1 hypothetical protein WS98_05795 [Burkholderia territorii]KWE80717.1 hypothetical protein WT54_24760 [Burkholderia territorii]
MKRVAYRAAVIAWVLVASVSLARLCLTHESFALPIPEHAWAWLFTHVPGFRDGEAGDDLVIVVHWLMALAIVMPATWLALRMLRNLKRHATR